MVARRREILDEEVLTQYGQADAVAGEPVFRDRPRIKDSGRLSLIIGELSADEACRLVQGRRCYNHADCDVRHTTAGALRKGGFTVEHAPTHKNPNHARAEWPQDWGDETAGAFNLCFESDDEGS